MKKRKLKGADRFLRRLCGQSKPEYPDWPNHHNFAFTIIDDTDRSTVENTEPMYRMLAALGFRSTKTIWILPSNASDHLDNTGGTLADRDYADFLSDLSRQGFELALHGVRGGSSRRDEILTALDVFRNAMGEYPTIHINHYHNKDNLYWGAAKIRSRGLRWLYRTAVNSERFEGHEPDSDYFWGDICQRHISYVVDFSFHEINTLKINPSMPNWDSRRPYVPAWFQTSDGGTVEAFVDLLSDQNLDQLESEGGACLVYTHFGKGFCRNGEVRLDVANRLAALSKRNGWFVPARTLLDFLKQRGTGPNELSAKHSRYIQYRWLLEKLLFGAS